jgi:glycosyltransferase involved in cell wall biosynthesis
MPISFDMFGERYNFNVFFQLHHDEFYGNKDSVLYWANQLKPDLMGFLSDSFMLKWIGEKKPKWKEICKPNTKSLFYFPFDSDHVYAGAKEVMEQIDIRVAMAKWGQRVLKEGTGLDSHYIPHGFDPNVFRPIKDKEGLKKSAGFENKFVVGMVARNQCFPAGTMIKSVVGDIPIENVATDLIVISGNGERKKVKNVFVRRANEKFITLHPQGIDSLKCTANHEIYAIKKKTNKGHHKLEDMYKNEEPQKMKAENLEIGDYLVVPITKCYCDVITPFGKFDKGFARLLGYYLAEGFVARDLQRIIWTFHKDEIDYINEVEALIKSLFNKPVGHQYVDNVCHITLYHRELAEYLKNCYGRTSREKKVCSVMSLEPTLALEVFKTYFNGDGSFTINDTNKCARVSSYSKQLIRDMQQILIRNSICSITYHQVERGNNKYVLGIYNREAKKLFDWIPIDKEKSSGIVTSNYILVKIQKIEITEEDTDVYDFEVEDDHNYIANNIKVSNSRKMIPNLFQAFKEFKKDKEDVILFCHCDPLDPQGWNLLDYCNLEGLVVGKDVFFGLQRYSLGIPEPRVNMIYNMFDIHVLPTTGEGFGLPIIESLACGIPNIATDYTSCRELIEGHGELIPPSPECPYIIGQLNTRRAVPSIPAMTELMNKLYYNEQLRRQYSRDSIEFAKDFIWDKIVGMWLKLFEDEL